MFYIIYKLAATLQHVIVYSLLLGNVWADWPADCYNDASHRLIIDETCYLPEKDKLDFKSAVTFCRQNGGDILSIFYIKEMKEIQRLFRQAVHFKERDSDFNIWIGCISKETCQNEEIEKKLKEKDCAVINTPADLVYKSKCENKENYICQYTSKHCESKKISISNAEFIHCHMNEALPYGTKIQVQCNDGYYIKGPSTIQCLNTGQWSEQPSCIRGCPRLTSVPNAKVTQAEFEIGGKLVYICDEGYVSMNNPRKSHYESRCNGLGEWNPAIKGCISETRYVVHYVESLKGQTIPLDCLVDNVTQLDHGSFIWLKNSNTIPDSNVSINGTLTIMDFNEETAGHYFFFWKGVDIIHGTIGYFLQLLHEDLCVSFSPPVEHETVKEGQSALLPCSHNDTQKFFTWYKDGELFFEKGHHILFPDGSLYFKNTMFQDNGTYICQVKDINSTCTTNLTVELVVHPSSKTVCGKRVSNSFHPWIASLWLKDEIAPFCYGTLIEDNWVVTTAHCLSGFHRKRKLDMFIRLGSENGAENNLDIPVEFVKTHPQFSKKLHLNDIGLVRLTQSIVFTESIRPICLSETDFLIASACNKVETSIQGTVVGWGNLDKNSYEKTTLKTELFRVVNDSKVCFGESHEKYNSIFCAEITPDTSPTFAGDAGSPFETLYKGKAFLFGIYSWGERVSSLGDYDFFVKIPSFMPWIKNSLDNHE